MGTVQVSDDKGSIEIVKNGPNTVEIVSTKPRSSVTVAETTTSVVEKVSQGPSGPQGATGATGPQGPQGPQGIQGESGGFYTHTQSVSASTWTITHNLGYHPAVSVVDNGENVVIGDVTYVSANALTISFSASFGGKAYLS
jgi:hypothetical protein